MNIGDETFQVGDTNVTISEFVVALLECPVGCSLVDGVSTGCTATNNMVRPLNSEKTVGSVVHRICTAPEEPRDFWGPWTRIWYWGSK